MSISTDSPETVSEVSCLKCGYDVRGLTADGVCPECGTSISLSTRFGRLDRADPLFLQTCAIGVGLLVLVAVVTGVEHALYQLLYEPMRASIFLTGAFSIARRFVYIDPIAIWLLFSPEWYGQISLNRPLNSPAIRWIATACALPLTTLFNFASVRGVEPILQGLLPIVVHVFIYLRLRDLARRGEPKLINQASIVMAVNIAATLLLTVFPSAINLIRTRQLPPVPIALVVLLGPGALIYAGVIWWKFREMLVSAAKEARDNWPGRTDAANA